jgi:hypothetical protein
MAGNSSDRGADGSGTTSSGTTLVGISPGQLATLLEGCEWRAPVRSLRPELTG